MIWDAERSEKATIGRTTEYGVQDCSRKEWKLQCRVFVSTPRAKSRGRESLNLGLPRLRVRCPSNRKRPELTCVDEAVWNGVSLTRLDFPCLLANRHRPLRPTTSELCGS